MIIFLVFSFAIIASESFAEGINDDSASASGALAAAQSQSVSQILTADDKSRSGTGSAERSGLEMVTNRRKVLAESSTLADLACEDVVSPQQESVLVVQAANDKSSASATQQNDSGCDNQEIGLSYKDSMQCWPEVAQPPKGSPNIVFIVLDDVGYGQIGCFGGPIQTPNIDQLAEGGLRYNNFHATAMCSPTRACLLTGRNHHSVGIGAIADMPTGYPGYSMNLSKNAATMAEMLRVNGFSTYAVGKWHLAPGNALNAIGPFDNWPTDRGFEKYYGVPGPETNQWYPDLVSGTTRVDPPATPEEGYHLSEDLVDQAIKLISDGQAVQPEKPYFLYLAFTAGHSPHHAPQEYIEMYSGKFDQGWDAVRNETLARQKAMGIVPEDTELPERNPGIAAWSDLSSDQKMVYAREQEVYAGFLTHTDAQIGRFLDYLDSTGQLDNTMIVFLSDNGASMEGGINGTSNFYLYMNGIEENLTSLLSHIDELGGTKSYPHYAMGWAMAGNTPFKRYKQNTHEGGIRDPMIIYYEALIDDPGAIREQYTHAIDVVPTVLEVLGLEAPEVYNGYAQKPIEGVSFVESLVDPDAEAGKYIQYYEM
ncbi:MAG: arylsulfatase, partial [Methanotrichaceae archaeon]|nr:arylsulfatase [Methanotrichaceae archaeon]